MGIGWWSVLSECHANFHRLRYGTDVNSCSVYLNGSMRGAEYVEVIDRGAAPHKSRPCIAPREITCYHSMSDNGQEAYKSTVLIIWQSVIPIIVLLSSNCGLDSFSYSLYLLLAALTDLWIEKGVEKANKSNGFTLCVYTISPAILMTGYDEPAQLSYSFSSRSRRFPLRPFAVVAESHPSARKAHGHRQLVSTETMK